MSKTMRMPCVLLGGVPGENTVGWVGLLGMDETSTNGDLYKCIRVSGDVYTWVKVGEGGAGNDVVSGYVEVRTTSAGGYEYNLVLVKSYGEFVKIKLPEMGLTLDDVVWFVTADPVYGNPKQLHINRNTGELWACTSVDSEGNAVWLKISSVTDEAIKAALGYTPATQEDVNALSEVIADKADGIIETATGEVLALSDTADAPLRGLTVYGKSTQDGTPTPDAPVPIVSVGEDGGTKVGVYGANLLKIDGFEDGTITGSNGKPASGSKRIRSPYIYLPIGTYMISTQGDIVPGTTHGYKNMTPESWIKVIKNNADKANSVRFTIETPCYVRIVFLPKDDSAVNIFDTTTTSDYFPMLMVDNGTSHYEPYTEQTLPISTPNGLSGIPVTSGGNYTDANGQQWVCDTVDFVRGVRVQRVKMRVYCGSNDEKWSKQNSTQPYVFAEMAVTNDIKSPAANSIIASVMCDKYTAAKHDSLYTASTGNAISVPSTRASVFVKANDFTGTTAVEFEAWLVDNPMTVLYALAAPIETPLTEDELEAYRAAALRTNYPNTTIYADDNAGLAVQYKADTKRYIDKKFDALAAAVLANA